MTACTFILRNLRLGCCTDWLTVQIQARDPSDSKHHQRISSMLRALCPSLRWGISCHRRCQIAQAQHAASTSTAAAQADSNPAAAQLDPGMIVVPMPSLSHAMVSGKVRRWLKQVPSPQLMQQHKISSCCCQRKQYQTHDALTWASKDGNHRDIVSGVL